MKYFIYCFAAFAVCLSMSLVEAQNKVVVVPLGGAVGDAVPGDVVKGRTFSSDAGKGLTGTLELPPCAQAFTNIIGMTFNLIPAGAFMMGSPSNEPGHELLESLHHVTLTKPFYMQVTEVTNKQWNALIVNTGLGVNPSLDHTEDDHPVHNVTWHEAALFANLLSFLRGAINCYNATCTGTPGVDFTCSSIAVNTKCTGYRLPTEAEWEYAARAGSVTAYANPYSFDAANTETDGGFNSNLAAMGWYLWNNTNGGYPSGTKPVAQKQANRWGLYDMHGNIWEWCQDWYDEYPPGVVTDPQGPPEGLTRVLRGGCWHEYASYERSAKRIASYPDDRSNLFGFRLVLSAAQ